MADKEINCAKARAGQASGPIAQNCDFRRRDFASPASAAACPLLLSTSVFELLKTYSDIYHDILKFTSPISGGNDFNRVTNSTVQGICIHRAEVRRSFITTTVRDESQVTPQGRHR